MIKLHTKFEDSMLTHYEDTKGNRKYRNLGGLGWLGVVTDRWTDRQTRDNRTYRASAASRGRPKSTLEYVKTSFWDKHVKICTFFI